jgi:hypothetical protein
MAKAGGVKPSVHRLAKAGLVVALLSFVLACYGSFAAERHLASSPLNVARVNATAAEPTSWYGRLIVRGEVAVFGGRLDRLMTEKTADSRRARAGLVVIAFVLPFVLGLAAALMGGHAMKLIERDAEKWGGNFEAVFAIMVGALSAVISGCMILAVFGWRWVPSAYTN